MIEILRGTYTCNFVTGIDCVIQITYELFYKTSSFHVLHLER